MPIRFHLNTPGARTPLSRSLLTLSLVAALLGCSPLPTLQGRNESQALDNTRETVLGRAAAPQQQAHPGQTGVLALPEGREAFATRMLLAEAAERSLDVQYYIWHPDLTGTLLMQALRQAADRGVRVRLLLDDNRTPKAWTPCWRLSTAMPTSRCGCSTPSCSATGAGWAT